MWCLGIRRCRRSCSSFQVFILKALKAHTWWRKAGERGSLDYGVRDIIITFLPVRLLTGLIRTQPNAWPASFSFATNCELQGGQNRPWGIFYSLYLEIRTLTEAEADFSRANQPASSPGPPVFKLHLCLSAAMCGFSCGCWAFKSLHSLC